MKTNIRIFIVNLLTPVPLDKNFKENSVLHLVGRRAY